MFDKLDEVVERFLEVSKLISDPEMINNQNEWTKINEGTQQYRTYRRKV